VCCAVLAVPSAVQGRLVQCFQAMSQNSGSQCWRLSAPDPVKGFLGLFETADFHLPSTPWDPWDSLGLQISIFPALPGTPGTPWDCRFLIFQHSLGPLELLETADLFFSSTPGTPRDCRFYLPSIP